MSRGLRLVLLGDPVDHSLSPIIHRAALAATGIEGTYEAMEVSGRELAEVMDRLRAGEWDGANVTMPHKTAVAALVDHLSDEARDSGSVNTLRCRDGVVEGHSTDVVAMREILAGDVLAGRPVLVLGSGGAAAAALIAARDRHCYLAARSASSVRELAGRLGGDMAVVSWGVPVVGAVVVNATPLGMGGETLPSGIVEVAAGLVDLPYGSSETPAVTMAREAGIPVWDGLDVLVGQAEHSFTWWTGAPAPREVMMTAVQRAKAEGD